MEKLLAKHPQAAPSAEQIFEIRFAEALPLDGREEVVLRLKHQRGVSSAVFDAADPTLLRVRADPARFSAATLRDFVARLWVGARLRDA